MADSGLLERNRIAWNRKPALRLVYAALYRRIAAALTAGTTLELGGGTGNFKEFAPRVITTDLQAAPWLDLVADAQRLPLAENSVANVVMIDVLHHLPCPRLGVAEAIRIVRPGGRIVLAEPAITPGSWPFYRWLHHEPMRLTDDPFGETPLWPAGDPYQANDAIPTLMFGGSMQRFASIFPGLAVRSREWLNILAYPLSGGFQRWCLLPEAAAAPVIALEDKLTPWLGRLLGFRMLVVLEKRP
jgi:SAM-dependent methyltransferase